MVETVKLDDFLDNGIIREKKFREKINSINFKKFQSKKVIIKGCSEAVVPTWAFLILIAQISQFADKIYYGELRQAIKIFNRKDHEKKYES
mgnify:CR=1 FL=1